MTRSIRTLILVEGAAFVLAALVHAGVLATGYEYPGAAIPEGLIGAVLLAGGALTVGLPAWTRRIAIGTQAFALMGTLVGLYVSVIGIGPHTVPDLIFHAGMVLTLFSGLVIAVRSGRSGESMRMAALTVVHTLVRATGLVQLLLGLAFWTGNLLVAVPFHMFNGLLFVLLLEVLAVLAAFGGVSRRMVAFAVGWGIVVPVFGLTQREILPGELHWIVQLAHLAVGLVGLAVAERLARASGYQTSPGRHSQLIGAVSTSGGDDGVGRTMM